MHGLLSLLVLVALGQEPVAKETVVEETLRGLLRRARPQLDYSLGSDIDNARKAVARFGPMALPGRLTVLRNDKACDVERYCAVQALVELDKGGQHAADLLDLLARGRVPFRVGNINGSPSVGYLARFVKGDA